MTGVARVSESETPDPHVAASTRATAWLFRTIQNRQDAVWNTSKKRRFGFEFGQ